MDSFIFLMHPNIAPSERKGQDLIQDLNWTPTFVGVAEQLLYDPK